MGARHKRELICHTQGRKGKNAHILQDLTPPKDPEPLNNEASSDELGLHRRTPLRFPSESCCVPRMLAGTNSPTMSRPSNLLPKMFGRPALGICATELPDEVGPLSAVGDVALA